MKRTRSWLVAAVTAVGIFTHAATAAITYCTNSPGTWSTPTDWDNGVPDGTKTVYIGTDKSPGLLAATVTVTAPGATASNVFLGYQDNAEPAGAAIGTLVLNDNATLTIDEAFRVGRDTDAAGSGNGSVIFGANTLISTKTLYIDNSALTFPGGNLSVAGHVYVAASYGQNNNAYLIQTGGVQTLNGNVYLGTLSGGNTDYGYLILTNGASLKVLGALYVGSYSGRGKGDLKISDDSYLTANSLHIQSLKYGSVTVNGDDVIVSNEVAVGKYQTGQTLLIQDGGTLHAGNLSVGQGDASASDHGIYRLINNASLLLTRAASGEKYAIIQASEVRNACKATVELVGGTIAMTGPGSGTHSLWIQRYENHVDAEGNLVGWGAVHLNGKLRNSGGVIADGYGADCSLVLTNFSAVSQDWANTGECGWYARDGGKLILPPLTDLAADNSYAWGDTITDTTLDTTDPHNAMVIACDADVTGGDVQVSMLATNRTDSNVTAPETVIGLWKLEAYVGNGNAFNFGAGSVQLTFRYDDALATAKSLTQADLRLWRYAGFWSEIGSAVNTSSKTIATTEPVDSFSIFAVATEQPGAGAPRGTMIFMR